MHKPLLVDCTDDTVLIAARNVFLTEEQSLPRQIKCTNCGAAMSRGQYVCQYCGTEWVPDPLAEPEEYRRYQRDHASRPEPIAPEPISPDSSPVSRPLPTRTPETMTVKRVFLFILLLLILGPFALIYAWMTPWKKSTKFWLTIIFFLIPAGLIMPLFMYVLSGSVDDGTEAVLPGAPALAQRDHLALEPAAVFRAMTLLGKENKNARRTYWQENYAGRWVQWKGEKDKMAIYNTMPGTLTWSLQPGSDSKIIVHFDMTLNDRLQALPDRAPIVVSGRLWRFDYHLNEIHLGDGLLVNADESPGH